ncbi:protein transport protein Sec16A isoform X3 [Erpetoichthys calabaricus]|uniref:protein transport protein Sec16A isoform X3 n=1 Tax=Erpetoichthys calabaricus TaxID=27687 RepID=UPI00109FF7B7|nr:protein transport protein Sec16A isoform X3 [Erpetoichthys calabaricus]
MQSPPQTAPAGATGPPPSGGIPNIFRRSSPYNRRANVPVSGSSAPVPPITDPFAYGRQTPQNAVGNPLPKSNPLTVQNQVLTGPPQTVPVQHQMNLDNKQGILPASGLGGVNVFTVNNMVTPVSAVGHNSNLLPMPVSSSLDSGQCNSVESTSINALQIHDVSSEISSRGIASLQNRPSYGHHTRGDLGSYNSTVPSAVPPNSQPSVINWMQDNRPPSDQNYLQPSELHSQNPSVSSITSSFAGAHSQNPFHTEHKSPILLQNASNEKHEISEKAEDNKHLAFQHSKQTFNSDNYFSQNIPEPWISQSVKDQFYHQEGRAEGTPSNSVNRMPDYSAQTGFHVQANHITYETDKGTVGMFFKGDEIENEETLSSESHASNGVSVPELYVQNLGMFSSQVQGQVSAPQVGNEAAHSTHHSLDSSVPGNGNLPLCNEGNAYLDNSSFTNVSQKVTGIHFDNVENLECVPNIEVLPSKPLNVPGIHQSPVENMGIDLGPCSGKPVSGIADSFEAGPNLETPDSVPHTVRSESVSSGYSNVSHSSNSNCRRPQGVVGTFIQQEVAKSTEEVSPNYFEQIDTSPSAEFIEENGPNGVYHKELSQPSTPSPPKPTGVFRASANSSFEPVRSRGVGIKPAEIDKARLVMEKSKDTFVSDASPGNLEHPPDNLETLFMPHPHSSTANTKIGLENVQMVPEKRPSNRAHATRLKCQSPATTLWAQNEMPVLGANILLVPAAPAVHHNLVKQPSTEVIQPPEDGPLEHQLEQQVQAQDSLSFKPRTTLENLENPPTIGTGEYLKQHPNVSYASLLIPSPPADSFNNQAHLIAQPTQNYTLPPPNNCPVSVPNQSNKNVFDSLNRNANELILPGASLAPIANSGQTGLSINSSLPNKQWPQFSVTSNQPGITSSQPANLSVQTLPGQAPLNLAQDSRSNEKRSPESASFDPSTSLSNSSSDPSLLQVQSVNPLFSESNTQTQTIVTHQVSSNYELLDFTMHAVNQSRCSTHSNQLPATGSHPSTSASVGMKQENQTINASDFYLQVTKDAKLSTVSGIEQNGQPKLLPSLPSQQNTVNSSQPTTNMYHQSPPPAVFHGNDAQDAKSVTSNKNYPSVHLVPKESLESEASDPPSRYENAAPKVPLNPMYVPPGADLQTQSFNSSLQFPQVSRPGPSHTPQQIYGPPPQQQISAYGYYGGGAYPDYSGGRQGPYPSPYPLDPRTAQAYYKEEQYRRYDRIGQYENYNPTREAERHPYPEQPERPSSRGSQYSDRPPSRRQGHSEDYYQRGAPSAFDYYYGDPSLWDPRYDPAAYDPRYHEYYDPRYWYYDLEAYRRRDPYYSQHYPRREGYDDRWQYDPRYDSSFDDEFVKRREPYGDDCDRRSVHSEHSARSVHSTRSQNSRRSSFSSRSQQSQVYRSQPDLVATGYDISGQPVSGPTNYSYSHYHDNVDGHQGFSEYPYQPGYVPDSTWPSVEQVPPRPATPEKFSIPHMCGRFGPGGQLLKVLPNLPSEGQPALVEIYSMEVILQNTQEQQDLLSFPGPLVKGETHKVDVIKFAQNRAVECLRNECLIDRDSANLIWEFIVLLCRQNGTVVGTDIADLLLREHKSVWLPGKSPNEANLIDFNNEPLDHVEDDSCSGQLSLLTDTFLSLPENAGKETERFRELLLFGRKKDALESAMKHGLWGHALLLASKMDSRTHARVMTRFANSLPINDPLQTVYQLMSGRMPAAATCCGDEKWGDWRPHLAMVLSNLANTVDLDSRTIITMGDTLASKGLIDAAHFCYIMAQVGLGVYTKKSTKLVLIGANHSLPFFKFACNEAIQRTEAYEYAQSLGSQPCLLPNFQVFKFIYACRLAEAGLSSQAFHYCEVISRTVLKHPSYYSPVFISQLIQISEKLRFFDPQLKEKPEQELFIEPDWLVHLRQVDGQIKDGVVSYNSDRATPQQYSCSTPSSEFEHNNQPDVPGIAPDIATDNPLMAEPGPQALGVHLMPAAPSMVLTSGISSVTQPYPQDDRISYYQQPASAVSQEVAFASPSLGSVEGFMASDSVPLQSLPHHSMSPATTFVGPYQTEKQHFHSVPPLLPPGSPAEALPTLPEQECSGQQEQKVNSQPSSPTRSTFPSQGQGDFYDQMAHMAPGRRSRTTSQSSMHMGYGRRSRTTSESSNHSVGRDRSNSASKQPSPPPPSILEKPVHRTEEHNQGSSKGGWFGWLKRRRNNEAHLPDDKNKSIVWDEKKQRWVNLDEPEEESKPPPPPPSGFPKIAHQVPRGPVGSAGGANAGPPVNIFSRKAGSRGRYVDVLNPGGAGPKLSSTVPAPADLFAPLAPMPIPVNFSAPEDQPKEGTTAEEVQSGQKNNDPLVQPQLFNPSVAPNHEASASTEDSHSGELSRCSSMSSLSREVSQHLNQISCQPTVQGGPPVGGVTFYNPSQFVQQTTQPLGPRAGRINQRRYPTLK